jgi:hypothetical protein
MEKAIVSVQEPSEMTRFVIHKNRGSVVVNNYCAMHSNGNVAVVRKCPRDVLEANIVSGETRRTQNAQSTTQIDAQFLFFSLFQLRTKLLDPLMCYAPRLPQQGMRLLTDIGITCSREQAASNRSYK